MSLSSPKKADADVRFFVCIFPWKMVNLTVM